jgi:hypothetical protein
MTGLEDVLDVETGRSAVPDGTAGLVEEDPWAERNALYRARLLRLKARMPGADAWTLEITATILMRHGLWD